MSTPAFPLSWPRGAPRTEPHARRFGKFGAGGSGRSIPDAVRFLLAELDRLGASSVVVSTNVEPRLDGLPAGGGGRPDDPGVAVYFVLDGHNHCMPCDQYVRVADNITAIAKHVEATRGQLRWGVADVRTAFAGFKALPARGETSGSGEEPPWAQVLGVSRTAPLEVVQGAYRALAKKHHPDAPGGDAERMAIVNRAWEQARAALGAAAHG